MSDHMGNASAELVLTFSSRLSEIDRCRPAVSDFCAFHGFDDHAKAVLTLIVEELMTNTVTHGGVGPESPIEIQMARTGDAVTIEYADRGRSFDPHSDLPEDLHSKPIEERPVGRFGWPLIRHYCRLVGYRRDGDANRIVLKTRFPLAGRGE